MEYVYFILSALFFSVALNVIYFSKKHLITAETKIFSYLLILNLLGLVTEVTCSLIGNTLEPNALIAQAFTKLYLMYLITYLLFMTLYMYIECYVVVNTPREEYYKKLKILSIWIYIICAVITIVLPINTAAGYATGKAVNFVYICSTGCLLVWLIPLIKNRKRVSFKKFYPLIWFMIFMLIIGIIQKAYPNITLITTMEFLIIFIMYHTIENPDLKMIQELLKNKEIVQNSIEEKSKFLFKMSQDIRLPIKNVLNYVDVYRKEKSKGIKDEAVFLIEKNANDISYMINEVLDISRMDMKNIKIYNTNYETKKFFNEIKKKSEHMINNSNIEINMRVNANIPEFLYGDYIKLKQVMMAIISNSIKYTKKGVIDIDINSIVRYDVCRLIINITDTGIGMNINTVNKILGQTGDLTKEEEKSLDGLDINLKTVKKILKMLGGMMNIKSEEGKGTTISIFIDQRFDSNDISNINNNVKRYNEQIDKRNRVLIVNDDLEEINRIESILSKRKVVINSSLFGSDCINKINTGEQYHLIIIKDDMKIEEALPILNKLKRIKKFNTPVIILLNKKKSFIKQHYIEDGFSDYIIKENLNSELKRICDKYF